MAKGQEALEKKLGLLETHQKEVHDSLVSIESEAARMYQVPSSRGEFVSQSHAHGAIGCDRLFAACRSQQATCGACWPPVLTQYPAEAPFCGGCSCDCIRGAARACKTERF